jgi:hypothetical protein
MSTTLTTNVSSPPRIHPSDMDSMVRLASLFCKTAVAPAAYRNRPEDTLVALLFGNALGLAPPQSLVSIQVIQGRPSLTCDAMLAIVRSSPVFEDLIETVENPGTDKAVAICTAKRRGCSPVTYRYGVADARRAGLWGKGTWSAHPDRMLRLRARTFALRDLFADLLSGITSSEEAAEIASSEPVPVAARTVTIDAEPVEAAADAPQPVAEAAAVAIEAATTETALESLRTRIELRVLEGKLGAAEATELVQKITNKLTTITKGDHDNG